MKHVAAIKEMLAEGEIAGAHEALEDLLALGPNNVEALKLQAALYAHQGRFQEEESVWRRIFEIDSEDEEVQDYFHKVQAEDREHYYFTDILPEGGRRFLAYPKAMVNISILGLLGCVLFLILTRLSGEEQMVSSPVAVMVSFSILVVLPWLGIIYHWARSLRSVEVSKENLAICTRFKSFAFSWEEIEEISLIHSNQLFDSSLKLVIKPSQSNQPIVAIDFSEQRSSIRTRRHLLQEIKDFHEITQYRLHDIPNKNSRPVVRL